MPWPPTPPPPASWPRRAVLAVLLVVLAGWGTFQAPASADSPGLARIDRNGQAGEVIHLAGDQGAPVSTTLFNIRLDSGSLLRAYCVDVSTEIDYQAGYVEEDWAAHPTDGRFHSRSGAVHWVLRNSYPAVGLQELREAAGIDRNISQAQAIAATQAAIWHYSNGIQLREGRGQDGNHPAVEELYSYLIGPANEGLPEEPLASLALSPERVRGAPNAPLGPFTVRTTSDSPVRISARGVDGVELVDSQGNPVSEAVDGEEVLVRVPPEVPEGTATVYARTDEATVSTGRLFVGRDGVDTQALIVAETGTAPSSALATVSWSETEPATEPEGTSGGDGAAETTAPEESASPEPTPSAPPSVDPSPTSPVIAEDKRSTEEEQGPALALTGPRMGLLVAMAAVLLTAGAVLWYRSRAR